MEILVLRNKESHPNMEVQREAGLRDSAPRRSGPHRLGSDCPASASTLSSEARSHFWVLSSPIYMTFFKMMRPSLFKFFMWVLLLVPNTLNRALGHIIVVMLK